MASRHPPDRPNADEPSEPKPPARNTPSDITPVNEHPVSENKRNAPRIVKAEDADDELDRIKAYLRGPTAFTA